jgi:hypothetical protein
MNCKECERDFLLAESGELGESGRRRLEAHVAECADCRELCERSRRVVSEAAVALEAGEPSAATSARILEEAGRRAADRPAYVFPRAVVHALAYAAVFAVVLGGALMLPRDGSTRSAADISAIMAMVSEDEGDVDLSAPTGDGDQQALQALAEQLLVLQGMGGTDEPVTLDEILWDPEPTAFRDHSIPALPARTRV